MPPLEPNLVLLLLVAGLMDLVLGDPPNRLHPVRLLGDACRLHESWLRALGLKGYVGGALHWLLMLGTGLGCWWGLHTLAAVWDPWAAFAVDCLIAWQLLCLRDLCDHGRRVLKVLPVNDEESLEPARQAVGRMVGRDTKRMDKQGVVRATIESLAENLTDGVLTPVWALCLGGMPALVAVKVISTLDSMIGYRNERYARFGWFAARSDDLVHFIPARLSALLLALAAIPVGGHPLSALRCAWRDHRLLPSPNSGWSEAAMAGALQVRLLGPIHRRGELVSTKWMGHGEWQNPADSRALMRALWITALAGTLAWGIGFCAVFLLYR